MIYKFQRCCLTCQVLGVYTIADIVVWPWLHALHENFDNAVRVLSYCMFAFYAYSNCDCV